jgi:hypothetical protein
LSAAPTFLALMGLVEIGFFSIWTPFLVIGVANTCLPYSAGLAYDDGRTSPFFFGDFLPATSTFCLFDYWLLLLLVTGVSAVG